MTRTELADIVASINAEYHDEPLRLYDTEAECLLAAYPEAAFGGAATAFLADFGSIGQGEPVGIVHGRGRQSLIVRGTATAADVRAATERMLDPLGVR